MRNLQRVEPAEAISSKRGIKVYATNPSVPLKDELARSRKSQIGAEHKGLVIDDGSGETLGRGTAVAYEFELEAPNPDQGRSRIADGARRIGRPARPAPCTSRT
jgi:hypothetical protein